MNTYVVEIKYKNITTRHIIFGKFTEDYLIGLVEKTMDVVCVDYEAHSNKVFIATQDCYTVEVTYNPIHSFSFAYSDADQRYMYELRKKIEAETFAETLHYLIAIRQR